MKRHRSWVGLLAILACLAFPSRLIGQSPTGTIQGTITDEQKAVVPGATVTILNVGTTDGGARRIWGAARYTF